MFVTMTSVKVAGHKITTTIIWRSFPTKATHPAILCIPQYRRTAHLPFFALCLTSWQWFMISPYLSSATSSRHRMKSGLLRKLSLDKGHLPVICQQRSVSADQEVIPSSSWILASASSLVLGIQLLERWSSPRGFLWRSTSRQCPHLTLSKRMRRANPGDSAQRVTGRLLAKELDRIFTKVFLQTTKYSHLK